MGEDWRPADVDDHGDEDLAVAQPGGVLGCAEYPRGAVHQACGAGECGDPAVPLGRLGALVVVVAAPVRVGPLADGVESAADQRGIGRQAR